jgi:D-alanyl-D-alanine carboxypeptidase (penicillin-binding protein 5/6)
MVNMDTGMVVYEKNSNEKCYPASTTKIMTALLAVESCQDLKETHVTIPAKVAKMLEGTDSSLAGYVTDEQVTMLDLLYGLMLPSGNECAMTIADYFGKGNIDDFVERMNERAAELGMKNTHYANPDGLHDDDHYTTAYDMFLLAKEITKHPELAEIYGSYKYTVFATNKHNQRTIYNTNYLMDRNSTYYYSAVKGIKTGRTNQSGNCLVSTATKNGYTYIAVVMGAPLKDDKGKAYKQNLCQLETKSFYEWAFKDLQFKAIVSDNQIMTQKPLENAWNKDHISLVPEESYQTLIPVTVDAGTVIPEYHLKESVSAPVRKGEVMGEVVFKYGTQEIGRVNLVAMESVDRNFFIYASGGIGKFLKSKIFLISLGVVVILVTLYIVYAYRHNRKLQRIKNRRKSYR